VTHTHIHNFRSTANFRSPFLLSSLLGDFLDLQFFLLLPGDHLVHDGALLPLQHGALLDVHLVE